MTSVQPSAHSRWKLERAIHELAVDVYDARTEEVPIWPGAASTKTIVEPLPGIRAALFAQRVARSQVYAYVQAARGAGKTWAEIAAVFDLIEEVEDPAAAVFTHIATEEPLPRERYRYRIDPTIVTWRCSSCAQRITDHGPYSAHPDDNETGHADTCERHTAAVAAYRAWDDE